MNNRFALQEKLETLPGLGIDPTMKRPAVYFSPSASVHMVYDCVVYKLKDIDIDYANNGVYRKADQYTITIISKDPDSGIREELLRLFPTAAFDRFYIADNLNHWVFTLYY